MGKLRYAKVSIRSPIHEKRTLTFAAIRPTYRLAGISTQVACQTFFNQNLFKYI
jgi:hypothetical protein